MDYKVLASPEELKELESLPQEAFNKIPEGEKDSEYIAAESLTYFADVWRRLTKNKLTVFGLIVLAIVIVFAIFGPIISGYTYDGQDLTMRNALPSLQHFFGTDKFGRDIFTRVC